ncbi:MAG: tetratricopeptide repeat protein [Pseudomonadota bacterium]
MKLRLVLPAIAPLLFAAACATTSPPEAGLKPAQDVTFGAGEQPSSYGLFLAGQAAMNDGHSQDASSYYQRAGATDLDSSEFNDLAFQAAIVAGDVPTASRLAPTGQDSSLLLQRLGALVKVVDALGADRGKEAADLLSSGAVSIPHREAAALLSPWAAAAAGDSLGAVALPDLPGDRLVEVFGQLGQAALYERYKRYDEAETDYKALTGLGEAGILFVPDYGGFLERRRRWAEAITLYDQALAKLPRDQMLLEARARAATRKGAPPLPTVRQGAARALLAATSAQMSERQYLTALAYLRMVLYLDPKRAEAQLMLGDTLATMKNIPAARAAYEAIPPGAPQYASARGKLAWTYQLEKDSETALRISKEGYDAAPTNDETALTYADLLRANDRYAESVTIMDQVIARANGKPDWRLLYMRGVSLERSGRWPEAETDLNAALAQEPNEPELLNYLGYSWIDRGERLTEAMDMVKRAVAANPRSGAMIDSLGWAYYRLGDYRNAVEKLEEAVLLEPADPEINNHLGDAYWRVGRKVEAEFQWNRALSLDPPDTIRKEAESKLKSGLPPAPPAKIASGTP